MDLHPKDDTVCFRHVIAGLHPRAEKMFSFFHSLSSPVHRYNDQRVNFTGDLCCYRIKITTCVFHAKGIKLLSEELLLFHVTAGNDIVASVEVYPIGTPTLCRTYLFYYWNIDSITKNVDIAKYSSKRMRLGFITLVYHTSTKMYRLIKSITHN